MFIHDLLEEPYLVVHIINGIVTIVAKMLCFNPQYPGTNAVKSSDPKSIDRALQGILDPLSHFRSSFVGEGDRQ